MFLFIWRWLLSVSVLFLLPSAQVFSQERFENLILKAGWIAHVMQNQPTSAGYIVIVNSGDTPRTLLKAQADFAATTHLHKSFMDNNVMKMRHLTEGIEIPANSTLELSPGGFHIMFMKLKNSLKLEETYKVIFTFRELGSVEIPMVVKSSKKMMKHDH